ncbi:MAG: DUF4129 domain-containing protein [Actinomycetota bacterium]
MILVPIPLGAPIDPDADTARRWLILELSKAEYQEARPTWFDRLSSDISNWLQNLTIQSNGITQAPILIVIALVVIAAIVAAYFVFGPPSRNRRSSVRALFTEEDQRDAAAMRRAATAAAARGDFSTAVLELFRCIARGLAERGIVTTTPGTTARNFAQQAGAAFPDSSTALTGAASTFDRVRYLGADGSSDDYSTLVVLERELRSLHPVLSPGAA